MKKVVYFNQWFSSIANVIDDLTSKYGDEITFVASSTNRDHAYKNSVDHFVIEDWESGLDDEYTLIKNYTDWVLNLCEEYEVDIFFVKKYAKYIMSRYEEFEELGITLISDDYYILKMMERKSEVYKEIMCNDELAKYVPEHYIFTNAQGAFNYLEYHRNKNDICLKFDSDEGGTSFRAINDKPVVFESLYSFRVNTITTSEAMQLISTNLNLVGELLFMELLDSPEISIDCYKSKQGFIALARMKVNGRKQKIFYSEELSKLCENIGDTLGLKNPYNVQFRVIHDGNVDNIEDLRLLEVNPRMSGGLYYETLYDMNIAEVRLLDALDRSDEYNIENFKNFDNKYVTHVEKALKLRG